MGRKAWVVVVSTAVVALGVGFVCGRVVVCPPGSDCPATKLSRCSKEEADALLGFCEDGVRGDWALLARGNSLAAAQLIRFRESRSFPGTVILSALTGPRGAGRTSLLVYALEPDGRRNALVLLFLDSEQRLVHVSYPLSPDYDVGTMGGLLRACATVSPKVLIDQGIARENGIIYVDGPASQAYPNCILVPDSEVILGLRYPSGAYSHFLRLKRVSHEVQKAAFPQTSPSRLPTTRPGTSNTTGSTSTPTTR